MAPHVFDLAPFWVRLSGGLLAAAITWIVSADLGVALVSRSVKFERWTARLAIGAAIGYALVGTAVAALGLFHAISPATIWLLLAVAIAGRGRTHLRRIKALPECFRACREALRTTGGANRLALAVMLFALGTAVVAGALPAVLWDPLAYHLPLAAAALTHGTFEFTQAMVQSGFPQLGEAAALPAYTLAGSAGAAMATLGAGVVVALLVFCLTERLAPGCGITAAMLTLSSGLWLWLAPSFYVDVPFAMFVLAGIASVYESRDSGADPLIAGAVTGALVGASAAVKLSGLAAGLVVFVFAIITSRDRLRVAAGFLIGLVALAGGWYMRSLIATGDPVYPFASAQLSHSASTKDFVVRYVTMTKQWCGGGNSLSGVVRLPWRLLVTPGIFCGDPGFGLRAGAAFALIGIFALRSTLPIALVAFALMAIWFWTSQQWRFALAPLGLYASIVAAGISALGVRLRSIGIVALSALCAYSVLINWLPLTRSEAPQTIVPAFRYVFGKETAADYLRNRLETFAAAQWLHEHNVDGATVLALDDVRDYYFPRGSRWGNPYYQQALSVDWAAPQKDRYDALRRLGIRYIVVNTNPAYTHRTPTGIDWTALAVDDRTVLHRDFEANGVIVYDLESGASAIRSR